LQSEILDQVKSLGDAVQVRNVRSGSSDLPGAFNDRFTIAFNYCANEIKWEVIMNSCRLDLPPDLQYLDDDDCVLEWKTFDSLSEWSLAKPGMLQRFLHELRTAFQVYQRQRTFSCSGNLRHELDVALSHRDDVEFFFPTGEPRQVRCLIPLQLETTSNLPSVSPVCSLYVVFSVDSTKTPETSLRPAPEVADSFSDISPPIWTTGTSLFEYIELTNSTLAKRLEEKHASLDKRKQFIAALNTEFLSFIEHDALYTRCAFLLNAQGHLFAPAVLLVVISNSFPANQSLSFFLISMLDKLRSGKCLQKQYSGYPFSPRWPLDEMARRIRAYIESTALEDFREWIQTQT